MKKKIKETQGNSVGEAEFEVLCCFDESVYYKKKKRKEGWMI